MYRNVQITQEMLSEFCENIHTDLIKIKEDSKLKNEMISKLSEQITAIDLKIETNKIILSEKNDNMIYRLSVLNDKMYAVEQKTNELNKIMMKHFAYNKDIKKKINTDTPSNTQPNVSPNISPNIPPNTQPFSFPQNFTQPFKP